MKSKKINPCIIIQARIGSKRFPGKMVKKLSGKTVIEHIIERLKKCKKINHIILSVPKTKKNLIFKKIANKNRILFFSGSENNLVKRFLDTAKKFDVDPIIRFPGDNIIPEPKEIDRIVDHHLKQKFPTFSSNLMPFKNSGYPDGIGAEVFNFDMIERVSKLKLDKHKKEHIHLNFINYEKGISIDKKKFKVSTIKCPAHINRKEFPYTFDINFEWQYIVFKKMYKKLYKKNKFFTAKDAINWMDKNFSTLNKC